MKLSLSLNSKVTILTLVVLPMLLGLGRWQLERADEKRGIELQLLSRQQQAAVSIEELDTAMDLAFMPVVLQGQFDNRRQFLLDNRMHDGQLGYEVLTPFITTGGTQVLVNRGWVRGDADRRSLPTVSVTEELLLTEGSIYVPPGKPFLLQEQAVTGSQWPLVVQAVEVDKFAQALGQPFFPHVVRLQPGAAGALSIDWQYVNQEPEKHIAYAVQWFTMAAALLLWFVFANTNLRQVVQLHRQQGKATRNDTH